MHFNQKYHFTKEELHQLYIVENKTTYEIAQLKGCTYGTIRVWLKKLGIPLRGNHTRAGVYKGLNHWDWTGGRYEKEGYIFVKQDDHPKAHFMKGYVREHVLVMEKHLGRYLKDKEVIHHINGNRKDNRIENLELMANQSEHNKRHKDIKGIYRSLKGGQD